MDTVAADHLALYGYERPTSPSLDELARRGSRFDSAVSSSSWTLPSHASMFTGRWPHELSVGWRTPLDSAQPTVAEFLRERGYATAGFIANTTYCALDSGLGRGYTLYRDYIFHELSPFKMAVMVQRSLDGLQTIGDALGDALDLDWLKAGVTRSPGAVRDGPQGGGGGQPRVPRVAGASTPAGEAVLRLPELLRCPHPLPALSATSPPLRRQAERRARIPTDPGLVDHG